MSETETMVETYWRVKGELRDYVHETALLSPEDRAERMRWMLPSLQDDVIAEMKRLGVDDVWRGIPWRAA